jgi:hypothetical protein
MSDRAAVPEGVSRRAKTVRRGGGSGSEVVGDYVGRLAGEAAQAVRRAGLRPGLDRSFGCPAELVGLVVAQHPLAGTELTRNGMVTLYVAARGGEPASSDDAKADVGSGRSDDELSVEAPIDEQPSTSPAARVRARRRRKRRHARRYVEQTLASPAPAAIESVPPEGSSARPVVESVQAWPADLDAPQGALEDELADGQNGREFGHEDFVVHLEDVLAGRDGSSGWRRVYPRRRHAIGGVGVGGRFRAWLGEHWVLAGVVGVALVLWVVVGVASTLQGDRAGATRVGALAIRPMPGARRPDPTPRPRTVQMLPAHKTAARPRRAHPVRSAARTPASQPVPQTAPRPVHPAVPAVTEAVVARASREVPVPAEAPVPRPSEAPAPRASTPPARASEQSGGGPFSP